MSTFFSFNMHDVTAPNIIMKWRILCANPVKPEGWELVYNKSIHYGEMSVLHFFTLILCSSNIFKNSLLKITFRRYF